MHILIWYPLLKGVDLRNSTGLLSAVKVQGGQCQWEQSKQWPPSLPNVTNNEPLHPTVFRNNMWGPLSNLGISITSRLIRRGRKANLFSNVFIYLADPPFMAPSLMKSGTWAMRLVQFLAFFSCSTYNITSSGDRLHGVCDICVELILQLPLLSLGNDNNNSMDESAELWLCGYGLY